MISIMYLLIPHNNKKIGFEIKRTAQPKLTRASHTALSDLKLDHLYVVHSGEVSWALHDNVTAFAFCELSKLKMSLDAL